MDFELKLGAVVGQPLEGPVTEGRARSAIFGYVLLNDWSARDIQSWEYQPLGPFQSKAFATTISPWIVTSLALSGAAVTLPQRERPLLPYLDCDGAAGLDISLCATLETSTGATMPLTHTNARHLYYSAAQQLAHHALSGCRMAVGDLLGSGTISGPDRGNEGCLLEATRNGTRPLVRGTLSRRFLEDGDCLRISGHARIAGRRVGFGLCQARLLPAVPWPEIASDASAVAVPGFDDPPRDHPPGGDAPRSR